MSRLGLRQIRKPNIKGSAFVVEQDAILASDRSDKQITNGLQTDHKEASKRITNGLQTDHKEITAPILKNDKRITERITSKCVNGLQTDHKEITNARLETLRGLEARLLQFIFQECRAAGELLSPPITLERISTYLPSHKRSAKTVIFRLVEKGFITREGSATGRGGFTRFRLEKSLYQSILLRETDHKRITNGSQTDHKEASKRITERITSPSSSSSINVLEDFKTTTTSETKSVGDTSVQLAPDWELDCSVLFEIGFTKTHLIQLAQHGKLTSEQVKDSMDAFAFDLNKNQKAKSIHGSPLNFFMGILRKGMPYTPPENYESPEDEAFRKCLESKRVQLQRRKAMEQELIELEFQEWNDGLTADQRKELAPQAKIDGSEMQIATLREYFLKQVYSQHQNESVQAIRRQIDQSLGIIGTSEGVISQ